MCVPMKVRDRTIGLLNVWTERAAEFNETQVELCTTLANQIALAIENANPCSFTPASAAELRGPREAEIRVAAVRPALAHDETGERPWLARCTPRVRRLRRRLRRGSASGASGSKLAGERLEDRSRLDAGARCETRRALGEMREVTGEIARERAARGRAIATQGPHALEQGLRRAMAGGARVGADRVAGGAALVEAEIARRAGAVQQRRRTHRCYRLAPNSTHSASPSLSAPVR